MLKSAGFELSSIEQANFEEDSRLEERSDAAEASVSSENAESFQNWQAQKWLISSDFLVDDALGACRLKNPVKLSHF